MTLKHFGYAVMATALLVTPACGRDDNYENRDRTDQIDTDRTRDNDNATGTAGSMMDRAGTAASDGTITMKIQAKYAADDVVKGHDIDVDTQGGTVTLKGHVESDAQRQSAERIARETDGVTRVVNELMIQPGPPSR